mgnify:CR=1 FL=1|jgi:hypothetical protein
MIYGQTKKQLFGYAILLYMLADLVIFIINVFVNTGENPRGCGDGWISGGGFWAINSLWGRPPPPCSDTTKPTGQDQQTVGRWSPYAIMNDTGSKKNDFLYEEQIDRLVEDQKNNYKIDGYTSIQLLAYVIIPALTIQSIGWWLVSTRASKGEWTFWILIITIIYTGLTTVVQTTSGIDLVPSQSSCLDHVTNSLGFNTGDELTYSFMARKADGTKCFIEGTYLGTPDGGIGAPNKSTIYNGDIPNCSSDSLPLY